MYIQEIHIYILHAHTKFDINKTNIHTPIYIYTRIYTYIFHTFVSRYQINNICWIKFKEENHSCMINDENRPN